MARVGSFSKAAHELNITQSAITKSVAEVEANVGLSILLRTSKGAVLTPEGREFVDSAERILADADQLLRRGPRSYHAMQGRIRIGVGPAHIQALLFGSVTELARRYRELVVSVAPSSAEQMIAQLRRGDIDVAFGATDSFAEWRDLNNEHIGAAKAWPFTRRAHPLTKRRSVSISDLVQYPFVTPSKVEPVSSSIAAMYRDHNLEPELRVHEIDNYTLVQQVVSASDSIGLVSKFGMNTEEFKKRFSLVKIAGVADPFPSLHLCCAYRRHWPPKQAVKTFISLMKAHAKDWVTD